MGVTEPRSVTVQNCNSSKRSESDVEQREKSMAVEDEESRQSVGNYNSMCCDSEGTGDYPTPMTSRERIREWLQPIYFLGQNPATLLGAVLTTSTALTMIAFWFYDVFLPGPPHPYVGILIFVILPGFFLLGLLLIPLGIWLRRRSLRANGELPRVYPAVDFSLPIARRALTYVAAATAVNFVIFGTATYRGVEYMDSTAFCGTTCHTVMDPEYTAYQNSPHSHVACVECHIGPGASWFVRSKVSGLHQ